MTKQELEAWEDQQERQAYINWRIAEFQKICAADGVQVTFEDLRAEFHWAGFDYDNGARRVVGEAVAA